jgi:GalNAc-alpha-(1->4)-GalNAc-alpha-(1->3)-diNAcBac-PP-undecaprenol alpha-1,4-N-acetyl-D-galactosaminyltransferase
MDGAKIAIVISDMGGGGAQRVASRLIGHWSEQGRDLTLITQAGPDSDFYDLPGGVRRIVIGGLGASSSKLAGLARNVARILALRRAIRDSGASVVVAFIGRMAVMAVLACRGLPVKVVISERNDPARQSIGFPWDLLRRRVYPLADTVTANTRGALETMSAYVPAAKLALVPNPVMAPSALPQPAAEGPLFLAAGRLSRQKGFDILLDAFARIAGDVPGWRLAVLGDGPLGRELKEQATALGIAGRVIWPGLVDDPFAWYATADVFVLSSRYEGMPNVMLEAMSMGLPVVASDASPGPLEYAVSGETALIVPNEDPQRLAEAMAQLAHDDALRDKLGAAARARMAALRPENVWPLWDRLIG